MYEKELFERCRRFHGHVCGGLMIGFRASLYAAEMLGPDFSEDEELVCIAENDACGVDAIQAVLGCSIGKGNLLFHMTGKQAFSFYDRRSGKSVRLVLKPSPAGKTRAEMPEYYRSVPVTEMFDVKPTTLEVPEHAHIFESFICDGCGEQTGSEWVTLVGGRKLCLDCHKKYDRFHIG